MVYRYSLFLACWIIYNGKKNEKISATFFSMHFLDWRNFKSLFFNAINLQRKTGMCLLGHSDHISDFIISTNSNLKQRPRRSIFSFNQLEYLWKWVWIPRFNDLWKLLFFFHSLAFYIIQNIKRFDAFSRPATPKESFV